MQPNFQTVKKTWWWIESAESLCCFEKNPFAQGYELWKRTPRFRNQVFFMQAMGDAFYSTESRPCWIELSSQLQKHFALLYKPELKRLGFVKSIFYSPKAIIFDCTLPAYYLIKALRHEVENPTPVASGFADRSTFTIQAKAAPLKSPSHKPGETESKEYIKQPARRTPLDGPKTKPPWEFGRDPHRICLNLPTKVDWHTSEPRLLTQRELLSFFRRFIRDRPQPEFVAYRTQFPCSPAPPLPVRPHVMALGCMALDVQKLKPLAEWLVSSGTAAMLQVSAHSAYATLANSKKALHSLITVAERV